MNYRTLLTVIVLLLLLFIFRQNSQSDVLEDYEDSQKKFSNVVNSCFKNHKACKNKLAEPFKKVQNQIKLVKNSFKEKCPLIPELNFSEEQNNHVYYSLSSTDSSQLVLALKEEEIDNQLMNNCLRSIEKIRKECL